MYYCTTRLSPLLPDAQARCVDDLDGLVPSTLSDLFCRVHRQESDALFHSKFRVRLSVLEVYRERLFDLLDDRKRLNTMRATGLGFHDVGTKKTVTSTALAMKVIQQAFTLRKTASTGENEHSSRSHALVRLELEHRWLPGSGAGGAAKAAAAAAAGGEAAATTTTTTKTTTTRATADSSTTNWKSRTCRALFVDLAGEECTRLAHLGKRDASGCAIGLGLLALQKVCASISKGEAHVPYRDSVLTRLLENALAGTCRTAVIGCVGGHADGRERTVAFVSKLASVQTVAARAALEDVDLSEGDPLRGDAEDSDRDLQRRAVFVETQFGDVFARVAGRWVREWRGAWRC